MSKAREIKISLEIFPIFSYFGVVERVIPEVKIGSIFLLLLFSSVALASFEDLGGGTRATGMGGAYVAMAEGAETLFHNPAGLGVMTHRELTLLYCNPFGLKGLTYGTGVGVLPTRIGVLGLGFQSFGNRLYKESSFILSYGNPYRGDLWYGFNLRYMRLEIQGYGSDGTLGIDVGLLIRLSREIKWGFLARNPNRPTLGKKKEDLPQVYSTGLSLKLSRDILLALELYKDVRFPLEVRFGTEFKVLKSLHLRTGVSSNPSRFSTGTGISIGHLQIDYAFYTHQDLGSTHQISLTLRWLANP